MLRVFRSHMYQMAHLIWTCGLVASPVGVILDYCTTVHVAVQEYWTSAMALLKVLFLPVFRFLEREKPLV